MSESDEFQWPSQLPWGGQYCKLSGKIKPCGNSVLILFQMLISCMLLHSLLHALNSYTGFILRRLFPTT